MPRATSEIQNISANKLIAILGLTLALLHGLIFYSGSTGPDDAYITYWAAKFLSDWGYLANYNGEAVEQSSSLLHVVILATLHKLSGISIITLGAYSAILIGGLTLFVAWRLACSLNLKYSWFVILFYAIFPYFIYWSFAGLETSLVALLVTLIVYNMIRIFTQNANLLFFTILSIFAYILARPEAIFIISCFFIGMGIYIWIYNRFNKAHSTNYTSLHYVRLIQLFGISLALFAMISIWRYLNFEQIFPQPVYAKSSGLLLSNFLDGIEYLFQQYWIPSLALLTSLILFGTVQIVQHRIQAAREKAFFIILLFFLVQIAFVVTKGNDWMVGGRFLIPVLPLLLVAGLYVVNQLPSKIAPILLTILLSAALLDSAKFSKYESKGTSLLSIKAVSEPIVSQFELAGAPFHWLETFNRKYLAHIPTIVALDRIITLLSSVKSPLVLFSGEMGMIPFYIADKHLGTVKFIDMFGLTTRHLTDCNLADEFEGRFGTHLFRGKYGIQVSPWFFLYNFEAIQKRCLVQYPDIIYGLGSGQWINEFNQPDKTPDKKYRLVYRQSGAVSTGSCWSRKKIKADYFILVHEALLAKINKLKLETYRWPEVKCEIKRSW